MEIDTLVDLNIDGTAILQLNFIGTYVKTGNALNWIKRR
jgi:hypothetical protein